MADVVTMGTKLPTELVGEMFNTVKGESALARLSNETPIPFVGTTEMVFSLDKDVSIVAENGAKVHGGADIQPVVIRPVKFEYGARFSAEMWKAGEEKRLQILRNFVDGSGKKFARGLDIAAGKGLNPFDKTDSAVVGANNFYDKITQSVVYNASAPDTNITDAVALVEAQGAMATGIGMSTQMKNAIASLQTENGLKYPAFAWGSAPTELGTMNLAVEPTISITKTGEPAIHAIVGDFSAFKWGYADDISYEVIEYGDPDNTGSDLKGHNQIYLRCEAYIGWGILAPQYFALVKESA
jgi:hypothetical protein